MMRKIVFLLIFMLSVPGAAQEWETHYEKSGGLETADYDKTIAYCKRLADHSPWIRFTSFGKSPRGHDLPLLIADPEGNFSPEAVHASGRAVLLIQAGIHPGESEGRDAGMMLIRDIAIAQFQIEELGKRLQYAGYNSYEEYLKSPHWQDVRKRALKKS